MNSEAIKTFVALAEIGSYTKTAQKLNLTQSAVSKRIKELETELNAPLVFREQKGIRLTSAGRTFLGYAQSMVELADAGRRDVAVQIDREEHLNIGSVDTLFDSHVSSLLRGFQKAHPEILVKVTLDHSQNLLNFLYDGTLDLCFTYRRFSENNYECIPFVTDHLILVTSPVNEIYPEGLSDQQIMELPLIHENLSCMSDRAWFEKIYSGRARHFLDIGTNSKLVPFLKKGVGYGFVVESLIQEDIYRGELADIPLLDRQVPELQSYIICRKSEAPAKNTLLDFCKKN